MTAAFCFVKAENVVYEFTGGFTSEASEFVHGVQDRLGIDGSGVEIFTGSDRDYAFSLLHAYLKGYDKYPDVIKVM